MWDTLRLLLTRYLPVCQVLAQQLCWLQWTPPGYCHANSTRPPSVQCSCVELVWEHNLESGVAIIAFNVIFLPRVLYNNFMGYLKCSQSTFHDHQRQHNRTSFAHSIYSSWLFLLNLPY